MMKSVSVTKNEHFLKRLVCQGGFMVFHGFWLVSMVFHGGFMVFMVFGGFHGFSRFLCGFSLSLIVPGLLNPS